MDRYDPYTDKFLRDTQYNIHRTNLAEVGTDCISKKQACDAFNTNIDELVVSGKGNAYAVERYLNRVIDRIKQLPPIRPAEPNKGKWIDTGVNEEWYAREYECSECGGTMLGESNFCPNCGADMREKGENSESN